MMTKYADATSLLESFGQAIGYSQFGTGVLDQDEYDDLTLAKIMDNKARHDKRL